MAGLNYSGGEGESDSINTEQLSSTSVDAERVSSGRYGDTYTVGSQPWTEYDSLATAYEDIGPTVDASNRAEIHVTSPLSETEMIKQKSHVDLYTYGHKIESTSPETSFDAEGTIDAYVDSLIIEDISDNSFTKCVRIRKGADRTTVYDYIRCKGQSNQDGGIGINIRNHSTPTIGKLVGIGGDGGSGSVGISINHNSSPYIYNGYGIGGNGGNNCSGVVISDGAKPRGGHIHGEGGSNGNTECCGVKVIDKAMPQVELSGSYRTYTQFLSVSDTTSFTPTDDIGFNVDTFLEQIHYRVVTAGSSGATVDIGTTQGGTEIVAGAPIDGTNTDSEGRVFHDYNQVEIDAGETIYFTCSEGGVDLNVRWVLGGNNLQGWGLFLDTAGHATISGTFHGNKSSTGVRIGQNSVDNKNWALANAVCRTMDPDNLWGIRAASDDATTDPIYNCSAIGGTDRVTPQ